MLRPARFPAEFIWGTATSAYQIEGARHADGKTDSIWDVFAHTPGKIADGSSGDIACDHYHRYREDIAIVRDLGLDAYRFSVSWPRVIPTSDGTVNAAGLDFYDRLVDAVLEAGIAPYPTLFHWDTPMWVHERGGWTERSSIGWFAAYADAVVRRLGDRVGTWLVLNEPHILTVLGHEVGIHAPGIADHDLALRVGHIVNLAHAAGVRAVRAAAPQALVGSAWNMDVAYPASDDPADLAAAERYHARTNAWYLDPLVRGSYPAAYLDMDAILGRMDVRSGDMEAMRTSFDLIGLNLYSRAIIAHDPGDPLSGMRRVQGPGRKTSFGWEVWPAGLHRIVRRVDLDYGHPTIMITENGCADPTGPDPDGHVHDVDRVAYLEEHLGQLARAMDEGADVRGYFAWSLLDNFEWQAGYEQRFGLVWVDFDDDLRRIVKDSARRYAEIASGAALSYDDSLE
jgi:beta-glucosidase